MAFYDKYIPKELKKGVDELLDFGSSAVEKGITKPFASISDKLIPNELRFLAPYAAGIGTLMLPPGMNMFARAALASLMNAGGQIAADESATGELGDLNKLSMAIAGGLGALGGGQKPQPGSVDPNYVGSNANTGVLEGAQQAQALPSELSYVPSAPTTFANTPTVAPDKVGFLEGVGNVGKKGLEVAQDYVQGTRSDLAGFGEDPASLFEFNKGNLLKGESPVPGLTKAAGALAPTLSLGTADVAYEAAIDARQLFDDTEAAEMAEAGASIDEIQNARRVAIREAMESAQFTDQDILDTLAEIGLKDGGIASLKNGGILGFNDGGPVLRAEDRDYRDWDGIRAEDRKHIPTPYAPTPYQNWSYPNSPLGNNFLNQSPKTPTVDNTNNTNNDKRRENVIQAMMAAKHSQATIDEALGELGLKNGGIADVEFMELVSKLREGGFSQQEAIEEATRQLSENMVQGGTKEIFERDTPLSEDLLGMSDGFTLSPVTLLRRYMANKELENRANGGIIGLKDGGMLDLGGNEMDYRGGGFIPMGSKERADDVPARLSKNEFVMTADAVRAAGGGSVNKGAQRMYDIMNRLEAQV
tara:strand:+ start:1371 stop:3134 length:1764 start_codon:yes stop_codon:yes gene_type:complete